MAEFTLLEEQALISNLDAQERAMFQAQFSSMKRDRTLMLVISVFLGGFGVDRFLLDNVGMGVLKLLTGGLFGILWLIDIFLIMGKTDEYNRRKASEVVANIMMSRSYRQAPPPTGLVPPSAF